MIRSQIAATGAAECLGYRSAACSGSQSRESDPAEAIRSDQPSPSSLEARVRVRSTGDFAEQRPLEIAADPMLHGASVVGRNECGSTCPGGLAASTDVRARVASPTKAPTAAAPQMLAVTASTTGHRRGVVRVPRCGDAVLVWRRRRRRARKMPGLDDVGSVQPRAARGSARPCNDASSRLVSAVNAASDEHVRVS